MGVKGLYKLLKSRGFHPVNLDNNVFIGKAVAIDGKALIYKNAYFCKMGSDVVTETADRIYRCIQRLYRLGVIRVLFVMDGGDVVEAKKDTLLKRVGQKRKLEERVVEFERKVESKCVVSFDDSEKLDKIQRASRGVSSQMCSDIVEVLQDKTVECFTCVSEADFALGYLSQKLYVDMVLADDGDLLVNGCNLIRDFHRKPVMYTTENVCKCLAIERGSFQELACLLGCDYIESIRMLGPVTALKALQKHKSIANVIKSWTDKEQKRYVLPHINYMDKISHASRLLCDYHPDSQRLDELFRTSSDLSRPPAPVTAEIHN